MPNRLIKESICTSANLNELTEESENFFYRILVNCDDYGICDARSAILRAKCYPLKLDKVTEKDVEHWLKMLQQKGLLFVYEAECGRYLQVKSWSKHQQIRAKRSKYPQPDSNGYQMISDDGICPRNPIQSNPNPNIVEQQLDEEEKIPYKEIIDYLNEKAGKKFTYGAEATKKYIRARWSEGHRLDNFKAAIDGRVAKWKDDPAMNQYLRPSTLFNADKFEGYVNSISPKGTKDEEGFIDAAMVKQKIEEVQGLNDST